MPGLILAVLLVGLVFGPTAWGHTQKFTITMREFSFTPAKITVEVGEPVEITLVNKGRVKHEFMVYDMPRSAIASGKTGHAWAMKTNFFRGLDVKVMGGKVGRMGGDLFEVEVARGKSAVLTFVPTRKGTFEFACLIKDHYEAGQKGVLVVSSGSETMP